MGWGSVAVQAVDADTVAPLEVGTSRLVRAEIALGPLTPDDVSVALYDGPLTGEGEIDSPTVSEMKVEGAPRSRVYLYSGSIVGQTTGRHGFRVRVLPAHPDLAEPLGMNCIAWG